MYRRLVLLSLIFAINVSNVASADTSKHGVIREEGIVPDAETAIAIAVAVWAPIYGKERIEKQKPYVATLVNGVWIVEGTLPKEFTRGGVAVAEISKTDGRVLRVSHGK
jgi:hypothetical protein